MDAAISHTLTVHWSAPGLLHSDFSLSPSFNSALGLRKGDLLHGQALGPS